MEIPSDWVPVLSVIISNAALFFWSRSESRQDARHLDQKIELIRSETNEMIQAIHQEMKDFHGRLERMDAEFKAHILHNHATKD